MGYQHALGKRAMVHTDTHSNIALLAGFDYRAQALFYSRALLVVLLAVPLVFVGAFFVWAARKDGEDDQAVQRKLGRRRSTRLGR